MNHEKIKQRAYMLWEEEGRPEGRHDAHWSQAERELMFSQAGSSASGISDTPFEPNEAKENEEDRFQSTPVKSYRKKKKSSE